MMNDEIYIDIDENDGFWDPYSAYISFEVDVSDMNVSNYSYNL